MTHEQRMFEADNGTLCAVQTTAEVRFDMKARKSVPLTDDIKTKIELHLVPRNRMSP
jgi:acyl-CoA thioesterase FadM